MHRLRKSRWARSSQCPLDSTPLPPSPWIGVPVQVLDAVDRLGEDRLDVHVLRPESLPDGLLVIAQEGHPLLDDVAAPGQHSEPCQFHSRGPSVAPKRAFLRVCAGVPVAPGSASSWLCPC